MAEIRCANKKHAVVSDNSIGFLERVCDSRFCKLRSDEVVTHRWDLEKVNEDGTIRPIETFRTKRFREPEVKGNNR